MDHKKFYSKSEESFNSKEEYRNWLLEKIEKFRNFESLLNKNVDPFGNNPKLLMEFISYGPFNECIAVEMSPILRTELLRIAKYEIFNITNQLER